MRVLSMAAMAALCFQANAAIGAKPADPRVAVLTFEAKLGFSAEKAEMFTMFIEDAIRARGFDVVGKGDIDAMLGLERMKEMVGCDDAACMAEIGGALGVDEVVHGAIGQMGSYLLITAKRTNIRQARVLYQATKKIKDGGDDALLEAISSIVTKLFGDKKPVTQSVASQQEAVESRRPPAPTAPPPVAASPRSLASAPDVSGEDDSAGPPPDDRRQEERDLESTMRHGRRRTSSEAASRAKTVSTSATTRDGSMLADIPVFPAALVGTGGLGLLVAGYFQFKAWGHHQNVSDADYVGRQLEVASGRSSQTAAQIAAGGGLLLAATGAVLWWLDPKGQNGETVSALVAHNGGGVVLSRGF